MQVNEVIPDKDDPSIVGNNDSDIGDIRYVNFCYSNLEKFRWF